MHIMTLYLTDRAPLVKIPPVFHLGCRDLLRQGVIVNPLAAILAVVLVGNNPEAAAEPE